MSTLDDIGKLAIFKLSLGSKELFHSNFLEFLWEHDPDCFIGMINELLKKDGKSISTTRTYMLGREKEHFDVCLYHEEKGRRGMRTVYDLVLENKVKSLPDKGQLDRYVRDIERIKKPADPEPAYLLLSLAEEFPDKNDINNEKTWTVVNYQELKDAIANQPWPNKPGASYIFDYCMFIEKLHQLGGEILLNLKGEYLFQDVEKFKGERLHDLYIKLRCVLLLNLLKAELEKDSRIKGKVPVVFEEHKMIRARAQRTPGLFLNVNIFRGVGQAAVFLYNGEGHGKGPGRGDIYEIVIQGDQYRHGINQDEKLPPGTRWTQLTAGGFSQVFLTTILSNAPSKGRGKFNHYNEDYVYKYRKMVTKAPAVNSLKSAKGRKPTVPLLDLRVKDLLTEMANDVILTAENLGIIQ